MSNTTVQQRELEKRPHSVALAEVLLVFAIAVCFSIYFTYPMAFHLGNHLAELGDSRLTTYIQAWGTHALTSHPAELFQMNMLYPSRNTLAGSENLLGNQLLFAPVYLLTGNPVLGQNFVILASFFLSAMTMYWLLRSAALPLGAAAVGGFVYGFALPRLGQLGHMQLLSTEWMPLIVLFLYRYLLRKRRADLALMTAALVLQILCSLYLGYLAVLVFLCYFTAALLLWRALITWKVWRDFGIAGFAAILALAPVLLPYIRLQREKVIPQESTVAVLASASPIASYLDVAGFPHHVYSHLLARFNSLDLGWEKRLFVGFVPLVLSAVAVVFALRRRKPDLSNSEETIAPQLREFQALLLLGSIFTAVAAYVLSLGPVLRVHDHPTHVRLPFLLLQRWVPGMQVFRVPARFVFAFMFGVAVLAGFGFSHLLLSLRNCHKWVRVLASIVVISVLTMEYSVGALTLAPVMAPAWVAPEYRWLAAQAPHSVTLELPITAPQGWPDPFEQAGYTYASVYHWQPLINGYSGYKAPVVWQTYSLALRLPDRDSLDLLAGIGLKYILVHENRMSAAQLRNWHVLPGALRPAVRFDGGAVVFEVTDSRCHVNLSAVRYDHVRLEQAAKCDPPLALERVPR